MSTLRNVKATRAHGCTRLSRRVVHVRAYLTEDVPPHVIEARKWIAAWRARQQAPTAAPAVPAATEVPPNVAEARAWIAAWRANQKTAAAAPAVPATTEVLPNVAEARAWIAAWRANQKTSKPATPTVGPDGTITFTF